jgi:hypothetical protein
VNSWKFAIASNFTHSSEVGEFARVAGAPSNRNLLDFNVDACVVMKAPYKGRESDSVGARARPKR